MDSTGTLDLVEVRLHGHLGERFGKSFEIAVRNPAEALRALAANLPGFGPAFQEAPYYSVLVNGEAIQFEEIACHRGTAVIDFVPSAGGGKSEVGSILLFAAAMFLTAGLAGGMVAGAGLFSFSTLGFAGGVWGILGAGLFNVGMAALFMGIGMATAGSDDANEAESDPNRPSRLFNGAVNTTANGRPVPLCYGELGVGSHVISGGFYTEDSMT